MRTTYHNNFWNGTHLYTITRSLIVKVPKDPKVGYYFLLVDIFWEAENDFYTVSFNRSKTEIDELNFGITSEVSGKFVTKQITTGEWETFDCTSCHIHVVD